MRPPAVRRRWLVRRTATLMGRRTEEAVRSQLSSKTFGSAAHTSDEADDEGGRLGLSDPLGLDARCGLRGWKAAEVLRLATLGNVDARDDIIVVARRRRPIFILRMLVPLLGSTAWSIRHSLHHRAEEKGRPRAKNAEQHNDRKCERDHRSSEGSGESVCGDAEAHHHGLCVTLVLSYGLEEASSRARSAWTKARVCCGRLAKFFVHARRTAKVQQRERERRERESQSSVIVRMKLPEAPSLSTTNISVISRSARKGGGTAKTVAPGLPVPGLMIPEAKPSTPLLVQACRIARSLHAVFVASNP